MTEQRDSKPLPQVDLLTQPFWDAAKERRLVVQRCRGCGYYNHPPKPLCDQCSSQQLEFEPVSGRGTVYCYTVMRQQNVGGFEGDVPYVTLLVELEEQPQLFMLSFLPGSAAARLAVGQSVEVVFEEVDEGMVLPQFRIDP